MKKYLIILITFTLLSCQDYLDVVPDNIATVEMVFNTRSSAEKFLSTCYSYVPEHAHVKENFAMLAGDEIWYYAESDFYVGNETSFRLAKGMQNATDPYCNYWEGKRDAYNMFISIRDCNILIDNLKTVPGLEMNEKNRWLAEVKTLKAFYHFWLMRMYGPIPIVKENISILANPEDFLVTRQPVDSVVNYIVELLDEAINSGDLPEYIQFIHTENGRLTLPAAKAIKAKVLILAASPLFNGNSDYEGFTDENGIPLINTSYDATKWVKAKDACYDAIVSAEAAGHALYSFTDLLPIGDISDELRQELSLRATITDRYNTELIWGVGPNWTRELQEWCQPRWTEEHAADFNACKKSHAPTLNVVEDFYTINGIPIDEDKNWDYANRFQTIDINGQIGDDHKYYLQNNYTTAKMHTYREPRFYSSVGFDGGKWFSMETKSDSLIPYLNAKAGQLSGKSGFEIYSATGYFTKKLVNYENIIKEVGKTIEGYVMPIIRLSDLYLMYAEALNEVQTAPDQNVYEYIQRVRHKAGLDQDSDLVSTWAMHSKNPNKPLTKEGMREIIQRERIIEFAFEGGRYWDLTRWKLAGEYFNKPIRGWNIYADDVDGFYQVKNIFYRDFLTKHYLWPISQDEMLRNPNIIQSPGW